MLQVADVLGMHDAEYDRLVDAARAKCMQEVSLQQTHKKSQCAQLQQATAELQGALEQLKGFVSRGLLSQASSDLTVKELNSKVQSNNEQVLCIEQDLAIMTSASLDTQIDRLVTNIVLEGCRRSKKRRRTESLTH